ncbi:hypothetical protein [Isobaculum melis]|uniref:Uncharacterized protein n=1 Tax=Isobaculum melis TaxID=142588 RepID=A0A1H9PRW6_9LACT|nr:hypothetical protein [Isobaculum melis]SER50555.1 hypothetical protein SAMN04488559_10177 [Isobaculum melis]
MRIYVQFNKKEINLNYRELAEKMWFKTYQEEPLELSHTGNSETLQENYRLGLKWDKGLNDERWQSKKTLWKYEDISVNPIRNNSILYFETRHIYLLSVDKRALYIMVIAFAKEVEGLISEDATKTWETVEEFENKHYDLLNLSFEKSNEISLVEADTLEMIEEPWDNEVEYT